MRALLILSFGSIFVFMLIMTTLTSMKMPIWEAFATFGDNPWAVATLWDAYFGFLTFYVWVAWKETRNSRRLLWFILIMALGNITMSLYVLIQLFGLNKDMDPSVILHTRNE
jgi:hypothetical protein